MKEYENKKINILLNILGLFTLSLQSKLRLINLFKTDLSTNRNHLRSIGQKTCQIQVIQPVEYPVNDRIFNLLNKASKKLYSTWTSKTSSWNSVPLFIGLARQVQGSRSKGSQSALCEYKLIFSIIIMYIILYIILIYNNNLNEIQWRSNLNLNDLINFASSASLEAKQSEPTVMESIAFISFASRSSQEYYETKNNILNIGWGIDGINLFLLFLVVIITPIILIIREKGITTSVEDTVEIKEKQNLHFNVTIIIIEILLLSIFLTLNVFIFYIFFEILLLPMFYIIIVYSKKYKRIEASYKLFIYTIIGSFFFILNLILLYIIYGSFNIEILEILLSYDKFNIKSILWLFFFITFAIKIPMFPFHLWLPEAHTEAPTTGSVILAAIILKIGAYGFIKFNLILLGSFINYYYSPLIYLFGILSIIYSNLLIIRLIDIKKIIAYSSIIHMNYAMIALYSEDINSIIGFYYTLISHGLVSSSLFLLIGVLYRRYHTRNILYYKGLFSLIPIFSILWFYFLISNMSLPLTPSFPGEFLILLGINKNSFIISIIISFFLIFSTSYNILLLNKILYGQVSLYLLKFKDLSLNEFFSFLPLIIFSFILSIFCYPLINNIYLFISYIII